MMRLRLKLSTNSGCYSWNTDNNTHDNTLFKSSSSSSLSLNRNAVKLRFHRLVGSAKKKNKDLEWWERFFLDEQGNWFGWRDDFDDLSPETESSPEIQDIDYADEDSKFQAWKRRAEALTELREAQQQISNQESRRWEDWLDNDASSPSSVDDWDKDAIATSTTSFGSRNEEEEDDDLLYQDRVLRYASVNSAKFLAVVILVPWCLDFAFHDYALMPFLDRYVKTVPLAAQILDVRREQKLDIVAQLKTEQARMRLEVQIGKSPPLSDEQVWSELHAKAVELREDRRLENRRAFANIFSDMLFGISLFLLLYANPNQVALLKFTGYKIINNVSDSGKAFLIILVTDIFLGYHSESGWETLVEVFVEHYGIQADPAGITIFICLVPVIMDACVKLWMFKFLPRLSPKVANIFQEMKRH